MIRDPKAWEKFEGDWKRDWLATLSLPEAFEWMEDARREAAALRPDLFSLPSDPDALLKDPHLRLSIRLGDCFRRVRPPAP